MLVKEHSTAVFDVEDYLRFREIIARAEHPALAGLDDVESAAAAVKNATGLVASQEVFDNPGIGTKEGRTFRLSLSPGVVALRAFDQTAVDRREEKARESLPWIQLDDEGLPIRKASRREVREWSKKSRVRMLRAIAELDLSRWHEDGGSLAMVTLTLPGDWLDLAPNGKAYKRLVDNFRRAFVQELGRVWRCIWKLEFQRRGAPHTHILMRIPEHGTLVGSDGKRETFEQWLSRTWARIVGAEGEERRKHELAGTGVDYSGLKFSDPRRIAIYFLGHSVKTTDGKEYQHVVPQAWRGPGDGPGRFWGISGLNSAAVELDLTLQQWVYVRRILRKLEKAARWKRGRQAAKYGKTVVHKNVRTFGAGGALTGGFVLVNDAIPVAYDLARYLAQVPDEKTRYLGT